MKAASLFYFGAMNVVLFCHAPAGLLPGADRDLLHYGPVFHLTSFALLAVLMLAAGWPLSRAMLVALMIGYSVGTELIQGLLPYRACELTDCINDLVGIAAGIAMFSPPKFADAARLAAPGTT